MARASGIGTYIRNVVPGVARLATSWRLTLIVGHDDTCDWVSLPNVGFVRTSAGIFSLREQVELLRLIPRDASLFWATHYNFPLLRRKPLVVTIHDVGHLRLPEYTTSPAKTGYAKLMFGMARRRASALLFDSEFTRREFESLVGMTDDKAAVVHLGVAESWFENGLDMAPLHRPYFLYVGNIKPHKNLAVLLPALDILRRRLDVSLVVIGRFANLRTVDAPIYRQLSALPWVTMLGEVDEATVRRYVRHATGLILPSVYEGFGLPPLEAMASGCPAIVSRAGSLPEVCGDAALYFDPHDPAELASAMLAVATDGEARKAMIARGATHARRFDWIATSRKTHAVLQSAVSASPSASAPATSARAQSS